MPDSVCVFGDSVAKGIAFDSVLRRYTFIKESFAYILQSRLKVRIANYSKFGCTISKGREIISRHTDELPGFTYTALEFGGNDCDFDWAAVSLAPDKEHLPKTPVTEFETIYSEIIEDVSNKGGRPVLVTLPPINAERYFKWISKGLNAGNILSWLKDVERIYRWHELYSLTVSKLAAKFKLPLVDIRRAFLESNDYPDLICEDGIHPNSKGHLLISNVIETYMHDSILKAGVSC